MRKHGLVIVAKRWFQKSYGNTYHSVSIYQGGQRVAYTPTPRYGYGDQWIVTAGELLNAEWRTRRDLLDAGISNFVVVDVPREKDL